MPAPEPGVDRSDRPLGPSPNKVDWIVGHWLYLIATGKWSPGSRLPSIREAERSWGVNRLTVQKAYRRLEEMGLATARPQSGYFVAEPQRLNRVSRYRHELDRLYRQVIGQIRSHTDLSPLPVFRYLAGLAEIETRERPDCAFVECTAIQARGHAGEIRERLHVPVTALTTEEIAGKRARVPQHVRHLLTSHFHIAEIAPLADPPGLSITPIPIEVAPGPLWEIATEEAVLLETEETMAGSIANDVERLLSHVPLSVQSVPDVEAALERMLGPGAAPSGVAVLLSPRVWGAIGDRWRAHPRVRPVTFRICEDAWELVADTIGLPLGDLGEL